MTISSKPPAGSLCAPELLRADHYLENFDCGSAVLNEWFRRRALKNQVSGASRTYVLCQGQQVIAFYCLAAGHILNADAPSPVRRNMPRQIPVIVIGRLAVDRQRHNQGLGRLLLRDAVLRTLQASTVAGIRAILVHAKSEEATRFYTRCGFVPSPTDPMTLLITIKDARAILGIRDQG